jgi:hypothetical protein
MSTRHYQTGRYVPEDIKRQTSYTVIIFITLMVQHNSMLWRNGGGGGGRNKSVLILNLSARWGRVVNASPRQVYLAKGVPVSIVQEAGWDPGALWMVVEKRKSTALAGISTTICTYFYDHHSTFRMLSYKFLIICYWSAARLSVKTMLFHLILRYYDVTLCLTWGCVIFEVLPRSNRAYYHEHN